MTSTHPEDTKSKRISEIRNRWTGALIRTVPAGPDGRAAVLTDAVLGGADLTDADLTDAVLRGAVLTDAVLRGAVLTDADLTDAVLTRAVLRGIAVNHGIPVIPNIHLAVYAAAAEPGAVVHLAGEPGAALEAQVGTPAAAALIYFASDPQLERVPDFYASNSDAKEDMKRMAEAESEKLEAEGCSDRLTDSVGPTFSADA